MLLSFFHRLSRSPRRWHTALGLLFAVALALEMFGMQWLATTEYRAADVYLRAHAGSQPSDPDIVVIDIDDPSMTAMQEVAGLWAWPREIHADLLEALAPFSPRAMVFDITFGVPDVKRPNSDARLAEVVQAMPNVYLAATRLLPQFDASGSRLADLSDAFGLVRVGPAEAVAALDLPHVVDRSAWRLGLVNSVKDEDRILRRYSLYTDVQGWRLPSLPTRVATALGVTVPPGDDILLRWSHSVHQHYSYGALYRMLTEKELSAEERRSLHAWFHNKIIVIGSSAAGLFDHHLTPIGAGVPGVDILARAIDNLKNDQSVRVAPAALPFGFGLLLITALSWAFVRRVNPLAAGAALIAVALASLALANAAIGENLLLPLVTPLVFAFAWFLFAATAGYLRERRSRDQAVSLFGRFLDPSVVRQIVDQGETVESLSGRTSEVTVLFSDIRGFTALSETRAPHEVVALLNRYFEHQVEVVFRHGGTLDKFIGDCIMAFWGAPVADPAHAARAVAAALEMQDVLLAFRRELEAEGADVPDFEIGIGVHSGPAVVGFIGAQKKLDYTAIGDTVNLASRIEGLTKGVARVLVSGDTMRACLPSDSVFFAPRGAFAVKGRTGEVDVFEPRRNMP